MKVIAQNKKALHDYHILERMEAGIVLSGDEVKSVRAGHVNMAGSFAHIMGNELWLVNCHMTPYAKAYDKQSKDEEYATRRRKLLLHWRQLRKMMQEIARQGVTIVPLKIYINDRGLIKVELGIAKGKKMADKRQALKERDIARQTSREVKDVYRY
jgi:SsrA-binding protein